MATSRRRCDPPARHHRRPGQDEPPRWVCSVPRRWPRGVPVRPELSPREGPQPPPARPRAVCPPCHPPDTGAEGTRVTPPRSPTDHACTPRGRTGRPGCRIFVLFYRDVFFTPCTVCTRAAAPPGPGCPRLPQGPMAAPSQPSPPSPPHGAGAVVVGNKSSLSVVPWGRGRCFVLGIGALAREGGGCHPVGTPSLSGPPRPQPSRILLTRAEPAPTRCLANECLIVGAKSGKLHGN